MLNLSIITVYAVYAINSLLYLEFHPTMALTVYFDDARCVFFCVKLSLKAWGVCGKTHHTFITPATVLSSNPLPTPNSRVQPCTCVVENFQQTSYILIRLQMKIWHIRIINIVHFLSKHCMRFLRPVLLDWFELNSL